MRGGVEVIDDVESRRALRPVDRSDVEEEVESELRLEAARAVEKCRGGNDDREHAVRPARLPAREHELCFDQIEDRRGHAQKVLVTIGWCDPAMRSCSIMIASMTVSGPRRATGNVDVHGNDLVDSRDRSVILVEAAARRAGAERHHPLGLAHLLVDLEQDRAPACA
jgi:hypothetical protein